MHTIIRRFVTSVVAAVVLATGSLAGAGIANAAGATTWVFHFKCGTYLRAPNKWYYEARAYNQNNTLVGYAEFNADSSGSAPDDALRATDSYGDGYAVIAHLSTGRHISTGGHNSPYTTAWATGNLPELTDYTIWVELAGNLESTVAPSCFAES
ncbi:hypothetical protein [Streptomyces mirabilis]|uniref:hypothetical protein n=1 Tax=Streptomyces mirabilis TaxID=68239 RepID=UPI0033B942BC